MHVTQLRGVFYKEHGRLFVADEIGRTFDVHQSLEPYYGKEVELRAHHRPREPLMPDRWGGGCCFWQSSGSCPFGHHNDPSGLFVVGGKGVLRYDGDWYLGESLNLRMLEGHRGELVVVECAEGAEEQRGWFEDLLCTAQQLRGSVVGQRG